MVVVSRVTTAGVLNGHGEVHANTKSHRGTIHTKIPSARGARFSCKQGKATRAESSRRLNCIDRRLLVRLLPIIGFMQL